MNARLITLKLLLKMEKEDSFSNLLLDSSLREESLSEQDKSFITACFYGVIEKTITLDYNLSLYLTQPLKKLRPEVLAVLRLGAYQLLYMSKVPQSAAVNESVKLVKKMHCAFASGLTNAVLRKVAQNGLCLPPQSDEAYLSVKYSLPAHFIKLWQSDYGVQNTLGILESLNKKAKTVIRVNTSLISAPALAQALKDEGVCSTMNELVANSLVVEKASSLLKTKAFKQGLFHVEDSAAQLAALALGAKQGERILDTCSAPGGKAFTIAQEMGSGEVLCLELHKNRVALISEGAKRLKLEHIKALQADACVWNERFGTFDRVLCDVPCSGLGTMRKKPEIRYKTLSELKAFAPIQSQILSTSYRYLKIGGTLVYSTCTLNKAENEDVVHNFLSTHPDCALIEEKTYFPHIDYTDGFYIAKIRKNEE